MKRQVTHMARRCFLKQGAAFSLAGAGMISAGSLLPVTGQAASPGAVVEDSGAHAIYVFASDPRAGLPGFRTIPG